VVEEGEKERMPDQIRGEYRLDVRNRIEPWKARVERVQRRTWFCGVWS